MSSHGTNRQPVESREKIRRGDACRRPSRMPRFPRQRDGTSPSPTVVPCTSAARPRGGNFHETNAKGSPATVAFVPWTGRCGWAGGGVGAQRARSVLRGRSADPAMGRSHGTNRQPVESREKIRRGDACRRPSRMPRFPRQRDGTSPSPTVVPCTSAARPRGGNFHGTKSRRGDPCGRPRRRNSGWTRDGTSPSPTIRFAGEAPGRLWGAQILPLAKSKRPRAKFSRSTSLAPSAKRNARTRRYSASRGWPLRKAPPPTS